LLTSWASAWGSDCAAFASRSARRFAEILQRWTDQIVPTQGRGIALRDVDAEFKLP
jgi:hypothetical protein